MARTALKHTKKEVNEYNDVRDDLNGKLQVRIQKWMYDILTNDLQTYTLTSNGTGNTTVIISKILASINEYKEFEKNTKLKILKAGDAYTENYYGVEIDPEDDEDRLVDLADDASLFIDTILTLLDEDEDKNKNKDKIRIDIQVTYDNASALSYVRNQCGENLKISDYVRNILKWYCTKPAYKREQILFHKTLKNINAVLNKKSKHFYDVAMKTNGGHIVTMKPYKLVHGKDDVHNYLIGIRDVDDNLKPTSLRLDNIDNTLNENFIVNYSIKSKDFDEKEIKTLERMISNNPAYPFYSFEDENYVLRFNEVVENKYKVIYTQRPNYISRKDNKDGTFDYTFDCSSKQMNQYLIRLISSLNNYEIEKAMIKIVSPKAFKDNFKDYYLHFIEVLKD